MGPKQRDTSIFAKQEQFIILKQHFLTYVYLMVLSVNKITLYLLILVLGLIFLKFKKTTGFVWKIKNYKTHFLVGLEFSINDFQYLILPPLAAMTAGPNPSPWLKCSKSLNWAKAAPVNKIHYLKPHHNICLWGGVASYF